VRRRLLRTVYDVALMLDRERAGQQGFHVLPRRWGVERSFGWMMRWRRLLRDYEERCDVRGHISVKPVHTAKILR
jgi:transposase